MASYDDTATVSGTVVSIENGADDVGAKSCVITVRPTLSGVSTLTETQIEGKDYLNGSTVVQGGFNINNGNNYASTTRLRTDNYIPITSGSYTIENDQSYEYVVYVYDETNAFIDAESIKTWQTYGTPFSISGNRHIRIGWRKSDNSTITAEEISGYHCYKVGTKNTYTASLGRTIYGGDVDIVNGTGTDGCAKDSMTSTYLSGLSSSYIGYEASTNYFGGHPTIWVRNWNYQTAKIRQAGGIGCACDYFPVSMHNTDIINTQNRIYFDVNGKGISDVAGFITFVQNLEANNESLDIVYELETKTDFTFTGQEVPTRLGYNAFWSEQGNTELTYYKDGYGFTSVTVNKTGRNLLPDTNYKPSNFSVADDGTVSQITTSASYAWSYANSIFKTTLPAGTYTAIEELLTDSTNASHGVQVFNSSNNMIGRVSSGAKTAGTYSATFTLTQATDIGIVCKLYDGTAKLYIVSGSTVHAYEPYEAVSKTAYLHKVIYGGEVDVIRGTCEPKNLGELSEETYNQYQKCTWEYITGGVIVTATGTYARVGFSIPVETGKTYTISYRGFSDAGYRRVQLNSTPTWSGQFYNNILTDTDTAYSYTFTSSSDTLFVGIYVTAGTTTGTLTFSDFMLVEGNTAEDYVPHFEPFSFPPISMETDDGENTLFANEGASAITYRKETD